MKSSGTECLDSRRHDKRSSASSFWDVHGAQRLLVLPQLRSVLIRTEDTLVWRPAQ